MNGYKETESTARTSRAPGPDAGPTMKGPRKGPRARLVRTELKSFQQETIKVQNMLLNGKELGSKQGLIAMDCGLIQTHGLRTLAYCRHTAQNIRMYVQNFDLLLNLLL